MSISKGTKGSIAELRIAANLMALGWQVFRNLSPNGSTDMVGVKGRVILKIQVKSSLNGQYQNLRAGNNQLLAIIGSDDGEIRYRAASRAIARMFPSCGLIRKPKKRAKAATKTAIRSATKVRHGSA
jgi:hypothetical protein